MTLPLRPSQLCFWRSGSRLRACKRCYGHLPLCARAVARARGGVIAGFSLLLAGCGLHPMYASNMVPQMASIYVEPIEERTGYELRNTLIDLLQTDGQAANKHYRLKITLNEVSQGVALQNDATITRYNDTLAAHYELTDAGGTVLTQGDQTDITAYNVVNSPYATLVAQQDTDKQTAQDMAERIRLALGVWFRHHP